MRPKWIPLFSIVLFSPWAHTANVKAVIIGEGCSKSPETEENHCFQGTCRAGLCTPCLSGTCQSSLACSSNGVNTVCRRSSDSFRSSIPINRRKQEAVECSSACKCADGFCNSNDDCPSNAICSGGTSTSTFSFDSINVCNGICTSSLTRIERNLQDDSEDSSNSPTVAGLGNPSASPSSAGDGEPSIAISSAPSIESTSSLDPEVSETSQPDIEDSMLPSAAPVGEDTDQLSSAMPSASTPSSPTNTNEGIDNEESQSPSSFSAIISGSASPTEIGDADFQSQSPSMLSASEVPSMSPTMEEANIDVVSQSPSTLNNEEPSPSPSSSMDGTDIFDSGTDPTLSPTSGDQNLLDQCFVGECDSDTDCTDEEICSGATSDIACSGSCILDVPTDIFDPESNSTCSSNSCTNSNDCFDGLVCIGGSSDITCSGLCSSLTNATQCSGNTCAVDDDCQNELDFCVGADDSERCSGLCLPADEDNLEEDGGNSTCTSGTCSLDSDCTEGEQCSGAVEGSPCSGECVQNDNTTPTSCTGPSECDSDLECRQGLEVCVRQLELDVCGTCMIPDIDDSDDVDECPSDTCRNDEDCIADLEICDSSTIDVNLNSTDCLGLCVAQNKTEVLCTSLDACKPGLETCEGLDISTNTPGNCTSIVCTDLLACGTDADCFDGLEQCVGFDGINPCSGQCVHLSCDSDDRTDSCSSVSDCPSPSFECNDFDGLTACSGTCSLMSCPGDTCTATSECAEGQKCSGSNEIDRCSGRCQTVSLRFRNYRGQRVPHFGKGFNFGTLFFSNRSILIGGRRDGSRQIDDAKLKTFLS